MRIRAGGRTWRVEAADAATLGSDARGRFCVVSFRPEGPDEARDEGVAMRWVPRPPRLTEKLARRLFHLAGERRWRDPRNGALYQVFLEEPTSPFDEGLPPGKAGALSVRFVSTDGSFSTPYDLTDPLGLARHHELEALLDRALGAATGPMTVSS